MGDQIEPDAYINGCLLLVWAVLSAVEMKDRLVSLIPAYLYILILKRKTIVLHTSLNPSMAFSSLLDCVLINCQFWMLFSNFPTNISPNDKNKNEGNSKWSCVCHVHLDYHYHDNHALSLNCHMDAPISPNVILSHNNKFHIFHNIKCIYNTCLG